MIEIMLTFIMILVFYKSKLWAKGEWDVNKTKFRIWYKKK